MNLAIHDFDLLDRLHEAGRTRCWEARRVVPWITPGQSLGRPVAARLQQELSLQRLEMQTHEEPFFLLFQQRLRRGLSHREDVLLFLAVVTGSVVLTGEQMVAEAAQEIGLPVCSGTQATLDQYFPWLEERSANRAERDRQPTGCPQERCGGISNLPYPEQLECSPDFLYHEQVGQVFLETVVDDLCNTLSSSPIPSSRRVPVRDEPVHPPSAVAPRRSKGFCQLTRKTPRNST